MRNVSSFLLLGIGLLLFVCHGGSAPSVYAQSSLASVPTENIPDCLVKLASAAAGSDSKWLRIGDIVLENNSDSDVRLWVVKYKYVFANGHAQFVYVLWPSSAGDFSRGRRVFSKPVEVSGEQWEGLGVQAITAQLFYVELGSGRICGEDTGGVVARKRATFWHGTAEKRRLLTLYREQGGAALLEALSQNQQPGEEPTALAIRQAMLRAYERKGLPEVLALLEKPAEASAPLVFVRSKN